MEVEQKSQTITIDDEPEIVFPQVSLPMPLDAPLPVERRPRVRSRKVFWLRLTILAAVLTCAIPLLVAYGAVHRRMSHPTEEGWMCFPIMRGGLICQNLSNWFDGRCYGETEVYEALLTATRQMRETHPRARVAYMDASGSRKGRLGTHRSHDKGIDVDILYIGSDDNGRPHPRSISWSQIGYSMNYGRNRKHGDLTFDAAANWAFLMGLRDQKHRPVKTIFVEPYIREWLLEAGKEAKAKADELTWARRMLAYAGKGTGDHKDHFHVRFEE